MKRFAAALFLVFGFTAGARGEIVTSAFNAFLDTGSLAGTRLAVLFSYDSSQVLPVGDSYVSLASFDFSLLGVQFTRQDIFQGGQVIFHDGTIRNVTASFQVILPQKSPVENITFGFGGDGVIGYIDPDRQYGSGLFIPGTRAHAGTIVRIRRVACAAALGGEPGVDIELRSDDEFPVRDQITVLQIGGSQFFLSRYPEGDLHTLAFTLSRDEFNQVSSGEPVIVQYGVEPEGVLWQFGKLDKSLLNAVDGHDPSGMESPESSAQFAAEDPGSRQGRYQQR